MFLITDRIKKTMITHCEEKDFYEIHAIINDAAHAYKGVIPEDRWKEPYMPEDELMREMAGGVEFWGYREKGRLMGVMGIQDVEDVTLIRHAYVRTDERGRGIGTQLLRELLKKTERPVLIGTWADAVWAVNFYQKNGFRLVSTDEKNRLLGKYWSIPPRQVETSVVLADREPGELDWIGQTVTGPGE